MGSNASGPHVAVLCEYDALPEIGHACGHNLIAEVGIGAGLGIKAALDSVDGKLGKVSSLRTISFVATLFLLKEMTRRPKPLLQKQRLPRTA